MEPRKRRFCILLNSLLTCSGIVLAQQSTANRTDEQHFPVGVWESKQPDGSSVGIDLASVPASVPDAVVPEGTPVQHGSRLQIGVFQRHNERIRCGEENFFVIGWAGPGSESGTDSYANGKLAIDWYDRLHPPSEIHVELVLDPIKDVWTGHFHRKGFDGQVTLHRTSLRPDSAGGGCIHIGPTLPKN
jgi:hypothetical protein